MMMSLSVLTWTVSLAFGASPLNPQPLDDESNGETFTKIADLSDGTYIQLQLAVSNIGMGDGAGV